uniref:Uncharacterized protein n=1 Tax=Biomphalaria glabrata TaxID=6526 RepID=A0A2C9L690_BIOGL
MSDQPDDDVKPTEEDGEDSKEDQSENTRNSRTKSPQKTQKKKSTSKSPSRKGRANKIYRTPVTPEPEELLFREKSFVLDCNAALSRPEKKHNKSMQHSLSKTLKYFIISPRQNLNKSTSIDGPVVDKFHREGAGAVYLKLRNEFGAGHSQETINGHAQFMQGVKEVQGYNGKYGFRRNTPFLRQQPTPFEPAIILPTH